MTAIIRHTTAVKMVERQLSLLKIYAARREVGVFYDSRGSAHHVGVPGEADIQGIFPWGQALAVEVKVGRDKPTIKQQSWARAWQARNGAYAVIRPDLKGWEAELETFVERAKKGAGSGTNATDPS